MIRRSVMQCLLVLLVIGTVLPLATDAQDTITLQKTAGRSSRLSGKITNISPNEVTIETVGAARPVPVNDTLRISPDGEPSELKQARAALVAGQFEQALEALAKVELPKSASEVLQQELEYSRALATAQLALRGSGKFEEANKLLVDFVRKNRNTFHFFESAELLGRLSVAAGNYENAARYFQQLSKAPWPEYAVRSDVLVGSSLQSQGKYDEAIQQYDNALKAKATEPAVIRQTTFAQLGKAACQAEKGETEVAIQAIENIIANNDATDSELFAQAYLALGTAQRKGERSVDAVLAYLHVDLLFYAERDAHAEALY